MVAGYRSYAAIAEQVADVPDAAVQAPGIAADRRPSEAMIRRLLQALDLPTTVIGAWLANRTTARTSRQDGGRSRSTARPCAAPHRRHCRRSRDARLRPGHRRSPGQHRRRRQDQRNHPDRTPTRPPPSSVTGSGTSTTTSGRAISTARPGRPRPSRPGSAENPCSHRSNESSAQPTCWTALRTRTPAATSTIWSRLRPSPAQNWTMRCRPFGCFTQSSQPVSPSSLVGEGPSGP